MPDSEDKMQNGFDPLAQYARLSERVENQGKDIVDLRSNMNTGFSNIQGSIAQLANELRGSTKTQWPVIWSAIGVSFAIIVAVGSQALSPVRDQAISAQASVENLRASSVSVAAFTDLKSTYENNRVVSRTENNEKFSNLNSALSTHLIQIRDLDKHKLSKEEAAVIRAIQDKTTEDIIRRIERLENAP